MLVRRGQGHGGLTGSVLSQSQVLLLRLEIMELPNGRDMSMMDRS
ncbi:hypothetical protein APTSU1_000514800 [Apodemus speciosus]|uniref:Uncharacterized protein n=1 Tax=Apodemus speciosus TaxID=105296 RepID=A0ABQ0ES90_APOSI